MANKNLIFVYNADSGVFNTIADIAHKITAPDTYECKLCSLTHGYFTIKNQWQEFLNSTDTECTFYHRDEFMTKYQMTKEPLPAIFTENESGLEICVSKGQLEELDTIEELVELLN